MNSSERINSASLRENSAEIVSCRVGSGCASCLVTMFLQNATDASASRWVRWCKRNYEASKWKAEQMISVFEGVLTVRVRSSCRHAIICVLQRALSSAVFVQKRPRIAVSTGAICEVLKNCISMWTSRVWMTAGDLSSAGTIVLTGVKTCESLVCLQEFCQLTGMSPSVSGRMFVVGRRLCGALES